MTSPFRPSRRGLLKAGAAALAAPWVWVPRQAYAQTAGRGAVRHLLYIRLAGGFRFPTAFNADVAEQFNPFGGADGRAAGTQWGVGKLLERATFLEGDTGPAVRRRELGMRPVPAFSNEVCVLPCVDHEPSSGRADGNHGTTLERFCTGYVGGSTGFLTLVNHGLRARTAEAAAQGQVLLPAFSLGEPGLALGVGELAAYRAPVLEGQGFERFGFDAQAGLPAWATGLMGSMQARNEARLHPQLRSVAESYRTAREQTRAYGRILNDDLLKVANDGGAEVDGISNRDLGVMLGTSGAGRRAALALRLFHFGCPAVFMNQGGYDMHSNEDDGLPGELEEANWLLSGLEAALKRMAHPEGGTYWDRTLVVLGSEMGRTTGGQRFNSAGGSDHASDLATRWMSMPVMGGYVTASGKGGRSLGSTRSSDLRATGPVYSYRSVLRTLMDLLGADHSTAYPDPLVMELGA